MRNLIALVSGLALSTSALAAQITIQPGSSVDLLVNEPTTVTCAPAPRVDGYCSCEFIPGTLNGVALNLHRRLGGGPVVDLLEVYAYDDATTEVNQMNCAAAAFRQGGAWYDTCRLSR